MRCCSNLPEPVSNTELHAASCLLVRSNQPQPMARVLFRDGTSRQGGSPTESCHYTSKAGSGAELEKNFLSCNWSKLSAAASTKMLCSMEHRGTEHRVQIQLLLRKLSTPRPQCASYTSLYFIDIWSLRSCEPMIRNSEREEERALICL